jgi:predicted adenylyl cyclase CyaB
MPSNIEIKARVSDFERKCAMAERLSGAPPQILHQRDTFFPSARGRLKLRELSVTEGQLVAYSRADVPGTKRSDYLICPTATPELLLETLSTALGTGVVVTKWRRLYLVGQTRIHLDDVEGLGTFLELEVVLRPGQAAEEGHAIASDLMRQLEVKEADLIDRAYADLLTA